MKIRRAESEHSWPLSAIVAVGLTKTAGCGQAPTASQADRTSELAMARVEVVGRSGTIAGPPSNPDRSRRTKRQRSTPRCRLCRKVEGRFRRKVKKGQVLAILSVPEIDAEADQKQGDRRRIPSGLPRQCRGSGAGQPGERPGEAHRGPGGHQKSGGRSWPWRAEYRRVDKLVDERAVNRSLIEAPEQNPLGGVHRAMKFPLRSTRPNRPSSRARRWSTRPVPTSVPPPRASRSPGTICPPVGDAKLFDDRRPV